MVIRWKKAEELKKIKEEKSRVNVSVIQGSHPDMAPTSELIKDIITININEPPLKHISLKQRFCKYCKNPESACKTMIGKKIKLSKTLELKAAQFILESIKSQGYVVFDIKQLLNLIDPERTLTDGHFQRQIISKLVTLGYIEIKSIQIPKVYKRKSKKEIKPKLKYVYALKPIKEAPACYNEQKDQHRENSEQDWTEGKWL